ncbi:hypothetical protein AB205_0084620 [Aquarana catesbeiana]|uniref:Uncharacterized protein n=1 Tax=Aquarana catesbeiana TaxID=8400 RepID=A0A2G9NCC7_AQUCT|nr:hypothetical protein AB205_0084620 [Aquarana catesbeiana]
MMWTCFPSTAPLQLGKSHRWAKCKATVCHSCGLEGNCGVKQEKKLIILHINMESRLDTNILGQHKYNIYFREYLKTKV